MTSSKQIAFPSAACRSLDCSFRLIQSGFLFLRCVSLPKTMCCTSSSPLKLINWRTKQLNAVVHVSALMIGDPSMVSSGPTHFHRPYVLPTVVCHRRRVPSSLPLAYSSPSGEKRVQCTGPKCPLKDSVANGHLYFKHSCVKLK